MVCAPVRSTILSLKLGDYLSVQAHKPCSISHLFIYFSFFLNHELGFFVCFSFSLKNTSCTPASLGVSLFLNNPFKYSCRFADVTK